MEYRIQKISFADGSDYISFMNMHETAMANPISFLVNMFMNAETKEISYNVQIENNQFSSLDILFICNAESKLEFVVIRKNIHIYFTSSYHCVCWTQWPSIS